MYHLSKSWTGFKPPGGQNQRSERNMKRYKLVCYNMYVVLRLVKKDLLFVFALCFVYLKWWCVLYNKMFWRVLKRCFVLFSPLAKFAKFWEPSLEGVQVPGARKQKLVVMTTFFLFFFFWLQHFGKKKKVFMILLLSNKKKEPCHHWE